MEMYCEHDVVVVGGGTAGLVAALSAAKSGASTIIIEQQGFLGGTLTGSLLAHMQTFHDATGRQVIKGIGQEIVDRLIASNGALGHLRRPPKFWGTDTTYDHEVLKLVADQMVEDAKIDVLFHTFFSDVIKYNGAMKGVIIQNKSGRMIVGGKVFVDATGDGDVAFRAGAPFQQGRDGDGLCQPASYQFQLANVDMEQVAAYAKKQKETSAKATQVWDSNDDGVVGKKPGEAKETYVRIVTRMPQEAIASGEIPEDLGVFTVQSNHSGYAILGHPHVLRVDSTNAESLSRANVEGRKKVWKMTGFLKKYIPGFQNAFVIHTPPMLGIRESRRIMGEYVLNEEDVLSSKKFEDSIAMGAFPIDVHQVDKLDPKAARFDYFAKGYQIPYRCLVPKQVDQLLVAGRCISATHVANASARVTPTCMAVGEAAGAAAALSIKEGVSPRKLNAAKLRDVLKAQGAVI